MGTSASKTTIFAKKHRKMPAVHRSVLWMMNEFGYLHFCNSFLFTAIPKDKQTVRSSHFWRTAEITNACANIESSSEYTFHLWRGIWRNYRSLKYKRVDTDGGPKGTRYRHTLQLRKGLRHSLIFSRRWIMGCHLEGRDTWTIRCNILEDCSPNLWHSVSHF